MHSINLKSHVGEDGILQLQVPIGITNADLEVVVIVHPLPKNSELPVDERLAEMGYSREFVEALGSWEGELQCPEQSPNEDWEEIRWDTF
jgi:hypothetical protein